MTFIKKGEWSVPLPKRSLALLMVVVLFFLSVTAFAKPSKSYDLVIKDGEKVMNLSTSETEPEKILEESDWKLGQQNDIITQTKEEPLYEIILNSTIRAKDMQDKTSEIELKENDVIYAFYSIITNEEPYF